MTLNIDATPSKSRSARASKRLVDEVVDELTSWNPREFLAAFQRWHQGNVSLVHLNVLMLLEATGPMSMSHLADALDISVASVTGVVDRMEARGLVERARDAADRRVVLVQVADGGTRIFQEIDQRRRDGLAMLLGGLSKEELIGLLKGHRALRAARQQFARKIQASAGTPGADPAALAKAARP